jgi:hypothetical protein
VKLFFATSLERDVGRRGSTAIPLNAQLRKTCMSLEPVEKSFLFFVTAQHQQ